MAREKDEVYTNQSILDMCKGVGKLGDKRDPRGLRHLMHEILTLIIMGFLYGCNSYRAIHRKFHPEDPVKQESMLAQLRTFLELPYGVPHFSTLSRTIAQLDPDVLVTMVAELIASLLPEQQQGDRYHICIDGKAIRAAMNKNITGNSLYIVNVVIAGYYLFTNQILVGPKKQEGKVIEENIALLLNGMQGTCTLDAMGTKKKLLGLILDSGCDAVLPVKSNNEKLRKGICEFIRNNVDDCPALVEYYADLNGYSEDKDAPAKVIRNTRCKVFDEDNHNTEDATEDVARPVETLPLFDDFYSYSALDSAPELDSANAQLCYVKVGDRLMKMVSSHGRLERREFELITDPDTIEALLTKNDCFGGWNRIVALGQVTRYRGEKIRDPETKKQVWNISITRTPYISTHCTDVREFAATIRSHWNVETWHGQALDKRMSEDKCTTRSGNAPENLSCLRKLVSDMAVVEVARDRLAEGAPPIKPGQDGNSLLEGFTEFFESIGNNFKAIRKMITQRIRSPYK